MIAEGVVVKDSVGIAVVENETPAWASGGGFAISPEPVATVGDEHEGDEYRFFGVVFAGRLSNGSFLVADGGSRRLRWFDSTGSHMMTAGAQGEGPGEFRQIAWVGVIDGDSVIVWDGQAGRMSLFHDGHFVRDVRLRLPDPWGFPSVRGALSDGTMAVLPAPAPAAELGAGVHRQEVPLWLVSTEGEVERELGTFPGTAVEYRPAATPGAVIRGVLPFGPTTVVAAGSHRVVVGDNARYELRVYERGGDLARIIRLPGTREPVTAQDLELELERRLQGAPPIGEIRDGIRANFEATPVPETKPYYDRVMVDADGFYWVRRRADAWDIINPEGRWLGAIQIRSPLHVTQIGSEFLIGVWSDEYGVEQVRAYHLERTLP